ncbi:TPA: hypothetical protein ACMEXA_005642 [Klebsiella variicola subsp. variicola]|uniref:hypothetical protein n=1 Tax=Klebsiella variicola TaxID=244366 RepID=UPI001CD019F5|nr:hypothetical protein [Klebsiella variicola]HBQ8857498.1 hypothetical protein [Klebsiella variicola subsp. variicola]HBQ8869339.1 hypothetical protein [Klebsiella pneumoniae]MEC5999700.1 hypothetical protein [Klebsiella variicola]UBN00576.1 hypothetical protein LB484_29375 [Klebsiella variicola]HBQ8863806.1 hypothetical protein [Klebsiella variicola subsp. variicola]
MNSVENKVVSLIKENNVVVLKCKSEFDFWIKNHLLNEPNFLFTDISKVKVLSGKGITKNAFKHILYTEKNTLIVLDEADAFDTSVSDYFSTFRVKSDYVNIDYCLKVNNNKIVFITRSGICGYLKSFLLSSSLSVFDADAYDENKESGIDFLLSEKAHNTNIEDVLNIVENNKTNSYDDLMSVIDEKIKNIAEMKFESKTKDKEIEGLKEKIEFLSFLLAKRDLKISALEDEIEELKIQQ